MANINIAGKEFRVRGRDEVKARDWVKMNRRFKSMAQEENGLEQLESLVELLQLLIPDLTVDDLDVDASELSTIFSNAAGLCLGKEIGSEEPEGSDAPKAE